LKEAALKRQQFTAKQDEWFQNSYNLPKNEKRLVALKAANPLVSIGAGARNRTEMPLRAGDFESLLCHFITFHNSANNP